MSVEEVIHIIEGLIAKGEADLQEFLQQAREEEK